MTRARSPARLAGVRAAAARPRRAHLALALALGAAAMILALWGMSAAASDAPRAASRALATAVPPVGGSLPAVTVAIDTSAPGTPVPRRFLGLSFEAVALAQISQYARRGNFVRFLRSLGPGLLRFGGITADQNVGWSDALTPPPAWASSVITPAQLRALGVLARRSGWRVLLTVGLAHDEPEAAAREVASAHRALGANLAAVEIGNEPNAYGRHGFRELPWIAQGYQEEVSTYRNAIAALTPGVPLAGPDVSGSGIFGEWGEEEAIAQAPALLTGHHYPLGCAQKPAPSIESLLSPDIRHREALSLATYTLVSRRSAIPMRIDETNSVSCGGVAGISNTFASALWASAYITQAMAAGVAGINLQGNPVNCDGYTPMCAPDRQALAAGRLRAQPDWYALLLTRSLAGERPLPLTITAQGVPNLVAAAFLGAGHSLQVVLVDDEPPSAPALALQLNVGAGIGAGSLQRLTAPSPSATQGTTLAGRAVAADGSWPGPLRSVRVSARAGIVSLALAPSSAALLTMRPRGRSPSAHKRRARH
jgi:hypothetical protein